VARAGRHEGSSESGDSVTGDQTAGATWAPYKQHWLPCRVLEADTQTGTLEVRVTDRTGSHEVWLRPEHVRGYVPAGGALGSVG
jgi:hypothetical protein